MSSNLLRVDADTSAAEPEEASLLATPAGPAAVSPPPRSWRLARPAVAVALACAAALVVAGLAGRRTLAAERWSGSSGLQQKQFLAMSRPAPGSLAVTPECAMGPLPELWSAAQGAPLRLKVMSYNLFWWKLFDKVKPPQMHYHTYTSGNGGTRLIADANGDEPHDVIGFQECMDEQWLLQHSGLAPHYAIFRDRETCMAYRKEKWVLLNRGVSRVAQDPKYGPRVAQWMRLKSVDTGAVVFFVNHHGPIPINSGGLCGAAATGYNILQVIAGSAQQGDAIVVVGDFNAVESSATIKELESRLPKVFGGKVDGGIDYILSNLGQEAVVRVANLGGGGSDHEALSATLQRGGAAAPAATEQTMSPAATSEIYGRSAPAQVWNSFVDRLHHRADAFLKK